MWPYCVDFSEGNVTILRCFYCVLCDHFALLLVCTMWSFCVAFEMQYHVTASPCCIAVSVCSVDKLYWWPHCIAVSVYSVEKLYWRPHGIAVSVCRVDKMYYWPHCIVSVCSVDKLYYWPHCIVSVCSVDKPYWWPHCIAVSVCSVDKPYWGPHCIVSVCSVDKPYWVPHCIVEHTAPMSSPVLRKFNQTKILIRKSSSENAKITAWFARSLFRPSRATVGVSFCRTATQSN